MERAQLRISDLLEGFQLTQRAEGRTAATIAWYRVRLSRFIDYVHDAPALDVSADVVRGFLVAVKTTRRGPVGSSKPGTSDSYVESNRRALAGFFTWAVREGHIATSPLGKVRAYKVDEREIEVLEPGHVRQLIDSYPMHTFHGIRARTLLALLYDTGIRVGELVRIDVGDLDLESGTVRVHGKSRRDRRVPISGKLRATLWTYLKRWRPAGALTPRLFTSEGGEPLLENAINQWLRRAVRQAGLVGVRVSPHVFRHSFATSYLRNGGDVVTLGIILGHRPGSQITMRYVHLVAGDAFQRHAIASPLERMARA